MAIRRFSCNDCGLKYATKAKLTEHSKTHKASLPSTTKKQLNCKICSEVFRSAVLLKKHQITCNESLQDKNAKDKTLETNKQLIESPSCKSRENSNSIKKMFSRMQTLLLESPKSSKKNAVSPTKGTESLDLDKNEVSIQNMSLLIKNSLKTIDSKQNDIACTLNQALTKNLPKTRSQKINLPRGKVSSKEKSSRKPNDRSSLSEKVKPNEKKRKEPAISDSEKKQVSENITEKANTSAHQIRNSKTAKKSVSVKSSVISLKRRPRKKHDEDYYDDEGDGDDILPVMNDIPSATEETTDAPEKKMVNGHGLQLEKKKFTCAECKKDFSRKYHLDRHLKLSPCSGLQPQSFPCHVCNRSYSRKDNLREHLRQHSGEAQRVKKHKCSQCNKAFHGQSLLTIHLRTHTGEKPFACDYCPKMFPSAGALNKHRRTHTGEKPFECPVCGHKFSLKGTLKRHLRVHTGLRPHKCLFCGKEFIQIGGLKAHMFYHTGQNGFKCEDCGKIFNRKARLESHKLYVHLKLRPFVCEHCPKSFTRKEDLHRHAVLHTGEKPFKCPTCSKTFAIKPSLKLHMLTHTKEEPRSCHECGRAFIRKDCLLRHMRKRHRDLLDKILLDEKDEKLGDSNSSRMLGEEDLCENITELLSLLVEESTLVGFGWPNKPVDEVLEAVIRRCGHTPVTNTEQYSFMDRMRENAKLLFTVVIDDNAVKTLLNNQTVDEVILHVLRLAKT